MPLEITNHAPSLLMRREAYERLAISRTAVDERLGLTADEFRADGSLVVIGPVFDDAGLERLIDELESAGLRHFEDYFDLSGNWPDWLKISASTKTP